MSIRSDLPSSVRVTLKISDEIGQELTTLVDNVQEAGNKTVKSDAASVASGSDHYKLVAGD